jgi:hypothetical protein
VVRERVVAVSITAGFTVMVRVILAVAPEASVEVTVSVIVRGCVVDVELRVDARRTNAVVGVEVSIVTPELSPETENVFVPDPEAVVYTVVEDARPAVIETVVGPVSVGAALTIIVIINLAVPPALSVTVTVS